MKKIFVSLIIICATVSFSNAQEFKKFKLGIGLGYAVPTDGGGGVLLTLEPAYRISDQIALGLRLESAAMAKNISGGGASVETSVSANGSYSINGQYYFNNNNFRPYVGLGLGIFTVASASVEGNQTGGSASVAGGTVLGFYPRIGFDAGHFNLNIDINIVGASDEVEVNGQTVNVSDAGIDKISNSYIGIRLGAFLFGGRN